jgi:UDP-glucose:glycoprotein glucosyltransferase
MHKHQLAVNRERGPYASRLFRPRLIQCRQSRVLPFDRTLGRGSEAILYADLTKSSFGSFHTSLSEMARRGEISYRLRYRPDQRELLDKLPVNGYGVELQLKRTDYIVIDDREAESKTEPAKPANLGVNLDAEGEVADLKPLSSSELSDLGVKAASFIMQSEDPFNSLLKLTQDFPKYSASIAAHNESDDFLREHYYNRGQMVPQGMNVLWMNGVQMIERQIDPYTLVDLLRRERKLIKGVTDLGLTGKQAVSLLGNREVTMAKSNDEVDRFDWRDQIEDGRVIIWLNNIEKDKRYAEYPTSLMSVSIVYIFFSFSVKLILTCSC